MLKNYVKLALRSLRRHKLYGAINIVGLAIGLAGCLLAVLFIRHELSFDTYAALVAMAFVLAVPLAYLASQRWLDDFAYRVEIAPVVFAAAGAAALLIALASTGSHAVRAALRNPADSLRYE